MGNGEAGDELNFSKRTLEGILSLIARTNDNCFPHVNYFFMTIDWKSEPEMTLYHGCFERVCFNDP